jgi:hypothetical protein
MTITGMKLLLYGGLGAMAAAVLLAVAAAVILHIKKNNLNQQLEAEFGKRRD